MQQSVAARPCCSVGWGIAASTRRPKACAAWSISPFIRPPARHLTTKLASGTSGTPAACGEAAPAQPRANSADASADIPAGGKGSHLLKLCFQDPTMDFIRNAALAAVVHGVAYAQEAQAVEADEPGRYAGKGFALDCLSTGVTMKQDQHAGIIERLLHQALPADTTYPMLKAGQVICGGDAHVSTSGYVLAGILVVLHLALLTWPLVLIAYYSGEQEQGKYAKSPVRALPLVLVGLGVFSLASYGEIAQHIHDNWLYLGLYASFDITTFYGALTMGQALLAWGIGGFDVHTALDLLVAAVVIAVGLWGTFATADVNGYDVTVFIVPVLGIKVSLSIVIFAITFIGLFLTTAAYVIKSWRSTPKVPHALYTRLVALFYILGIISAFLTGFTGQQWFHVPTASGFLLGFGSQVFWLNAILAVKVPGDSPEALRSGSIVGKGPKQQ